MNEMQGEETMHADPMREVRDTYRQYYIVGAGLSGLAAAFFLLREIGVPGERIQILEKEQLGGGACDGYVFEDAGYVMRGEHKLDEVSPVLSELMAGLRAEDPSYGSMLREYEGLCLEDPNYSLCRMTMQHGAEQRPEGSFGLSDGAALSILKLLLKTDEELAEKQICDLLGADVLESPFWLYFKNTYSYRKTHSALELKTALMRRLSSLQGLPDLSCLRYTRYSIYESLIVPLLRALEEAGVKLRYGVRVTDVAFDCARGHKRITRIDYVEQDEDGCLDLTERDAVLITLGSCVENSSRGSQDEAAPMLAQIREGGSFSLWRKISLQDPYFGHPQTFVSRIRDTILVSATVSTSNKRIISFIKKICKRDPFSGRVVTGGPVTVKDSAWGLSWSVARQPLFHGQEEGVCVIYLSGSASDQKGEYVDKPMRLCTGAEICAEWLFHLGVPAEQIEELSGNEALTIPVLMPFMTAPLLPRKPGDRPDVFPEGAENFAFIGQFAESEGETAGTVEYGARTALEAVLRLHGIERPMPDSTGAAYDIRTLLKTLSVLRDGRSLKTLDLKRSEKGDIKILLKMIKGTVIEQQLQELELL